MLSLLGALLKPFVSLLKLRNLHGKLCKCISGLLVWGHAPMLALPESLFRLTILLVLATVRHFVCCMSTPMLLV